MPHAESDLAINNNQSESNEQRRITLQMARSLATMLRDEGIACFLFEPPDDTATQI